MEKQEKVKKESKKTTVKKTTPVKTKIDPKTGTLKVVTPKKTTKKEEPKKTTKTTTKKATTTTKKTTTKKTTTTPKKTTVKKEPKVVVPETPVVEIVPEVTPEVINTVQEVVETITPEMKEETTEVVIPTNEEEITSFEEILTDTEQPEKVMPFVKVETPKKRGRKPSENPLPKKSSRELTIEPPKRQPKVEPKKEEKKPEEPKPIVRPTPKKPKNFTKEEKVVYKKLQEAFNFVANMTNVIEERTMDPKLISDLTVGELHVIEAVDQNNNKPMSLIAKKLKVTVGSLTISINRLVQKGYLLRTRHEMDHRIILISITQKGKKVLKVHDNFHETILGLVLDSLTLKQTYTVMNQFAMVLENYYDPTTIESISKKGSKK